MKYESFEVGFSKDKNFVYEIQELRGPCLTEHVWNLAAYSSKTVSGMVEVESCLKVQTHVAL